MAGASTAGSAEGFGSGQEGSSYSGLANDDSQVQQVAPPPTSVFFGT